MRNDLVRSRVGEGGYGRAVWDLSFRQPIVSEKMIEITYVADQNILVRSAGNIQSRSSEVYRGLMSIVKIGGDFEVVIDELGVDTFDGGASEVVAQSEVL
jgi:hypothetical protein